VWSPPNSGREIFLILNMEDRVHIYFSGRVQGVGFRFTARYLANKYAIKGWVANLPDGRVELLVQGKGDELSKFLRDLREEFADHITNFKIDKLKPEDNLDGFTIRFPY